MLVLILLYRNYKIKWALTIITLLLIGIALVLNKLTGGIVYKYLDKVQPKSNSNFLLGIQWTVSILLAFILPNNLLADYSYFHNLYEDNEIWIPVSMGVILFTSLVIIGILFGLIIKQSQKAKQ